MSDQTPAPDDGAADREPVPPSDGRARLLAALRRPGSRGQVVAGVLLAVLGFAAVTQVRSNGSDDTYVGARQGDLIQLINNLSLAAAARGERDHEAAAHPRRARQRHRSHAVRRWTRAQQQANTLGILAGTLPAEGPGIRVDGRRTRPGQRRRHQPADQRDAGAARRRRRGHRDQRLRAGGRADGARGQPGRGSPRRRPAARGAVHHRRDRRPAHAVHGAGLHRRLHRRGRRAWAARST